MESNGSFGVLYNGVVANPISVRPLMQLHFDLDAFVSGLNHIKLLYAGHTWEVFGYCLAGVKPLSE